jgi:drug/metabolite transporter (DMT)-like permease
MALLAGVFFAADLLFWHHAIEAVGAGLGTVLANTQVLIVGVLAWALLGERPGSRSMLSVPIVLAGVVLISGVVGGGAYGENPPLGVLFGLLTALVYSGFLLALRQGSRELRGPAGPLLDATLASAAVTAVAGVALGELDPVPGWAAQGWLVLLALSAQVLAWLLIAVSLPRLPALLTSLVLTFQPVATMLLAAALLDESPSGVQLLGVVAIVAGLLLASARRTTRRAAATALAPAE